MTTKELLDEALVQARAGEGAGFDQLVRLMERQLVGYARAGGAEDPEGLANETLVKVFNNITRFGGNPAQFRAWVFTMARHLIADEHRRRARRIRSTPVDPSALPDLPAPGRIEGLADSDVAQRLLALLTAEQREVLILRVVAGLSVDETARVVGRRPGAVRGLQHRALEQLRRTFSATS
jgi:RNA polymerase sigma-70 factor (ECF subfamily)